MGNPVKHFILRGFSHSMGARVFAFERVAADQSRVAVSVAADLNLTRRYGISLQELPLLCRAVLERSEEEPGRRAFVYTEEQMRLHSECVAARAEAVRQRKPPRKPAGEQGGTAWRGSLRRGALTPPRRQPSA